MNNPRSTLLHAALRTLIVSATTTGAAFAQNSISLNFTDSDAGSIITTGTAGAVPVAATNWNNLASTNGDGSAASLKDNTGAATSAAVTWVSANTWRNGGTTTTGNGQLTKGFLDDGGGGCRISLSNIPYLSYNAYVIVAADQGGATQGIANLRPVRVNGVAYSHNDTATVAVDANWTAQNWNDSANLVEGQNYLKIQNLGGLSLAIQGGDNSGGSRGPIAGLQIENSYTGSFSYWDLNGNTAGAGDASPTGAWSAAAANWNAAADGTGTTAGWAGAGHSAVFAAGTDATGTYTVNVSGTQNADAIITEQGNVTLSGGGLNLSSPAVLRAGTGSSLTVNSALGGTNGLVLEGASSITLSGAHTISGAGIISVPNLTLNGSTLPSLSALTIGDNVTLNATGSSVTASGGLTAGSATSITSAGSTIAIGGDINLTGASFSSSGASTLSAKNLFLNATATAASISLSGTSAVHLSSVAPAQSFFGLQGGSLTLADSASVSTDRWSNWGSGQTHALSISGNAQLNVTDDLVLGDQTNAAITVTQTGGTVTNTGITNNPGGNDLSNRWGHWGGGTTVYNISAGALNLTGAPLYLSWDGTATLNVSGSATVNLKAVNMGYNDKNQASTINLTGGHLNIGADGIVSGGTQNKTINLGAGTLGALTSWSSPLAINVTDATTIDTGSHDITLSGALGGTGSITKTGTGNLALSGTNTFAGPTNVNAGSLQIGGETGGTINLASGATIKTGTPILPQAGVVHTLNLASGSSSSFRIGTTPDLLAVVDPGGLTTTGTHSINIAAAPGLSPGTYPLFEYEGTISGTGYGAFAIGSRPHITATLSHNVADTSVDLVITEIDSLVWKGTNGSDWSLNNAQNWALLSNAGTAPYFQTDLVQFDDSAATGNVVISGSITPGEVLFNNSTLAYTLSGTGLGGPADLIKDGTAKVTLTNDNTYIGSTVVNAGTLQVGNGTSGSISPLSPVIIAPGAEFIWHPAGNASFVNPVTNNGVLRVQGTGNTSLSGDWTQNSSGEIIVDSSGITSFDTPKPGWTGNLTVNAGTLRTIRGNFGPASSARTFTFNGASTLLSLQQNNVFGNGNTDPAAMMQLVLNGATLTSTAYNELGHVTLNGAKISGASAETSLVYRGFELRGTITVTGSTPSLIETTTAHENHLDPATPFIVGDVTGSSAPDLVVTAPFRDGSNNNGTTPGGMRKQGPGTMDLAAVNTYTGATSVQEGKLRVSGSIAAGAVTVDSGATLEGTGSIGGTVTIASGATLSPGTSAGTLSIGTDLALNGTLKAELDGATGDRVNVTGVLDITNATLDLTLLPGGSTLGSYVLAQYGALTGTAFAQVNNLPAGYTLNYHYGPNSNQIALVNPGSDPYLNWATSPPYNLSGDDALAGADPDKDGISNGIEFVIGGNPTTTGDGSKLPTAAIAGSMFEFTFRRADQSNYSPFPAVQYGSVLDGWTTAENGTNGVVITVTNDFYGTGVDRVVVSIPRSLAVGQKLFARLVAQQ
ncbi:beta strand repeat-containing protein [Luteolibacter luteus]|uniref:Autotransporter-associated beta strand protein n=1 Tax=Luteolibacter luteus TaxID=2728835 RepID=A0A858RRZ6_9BACT|nr:autotransporter-associated beta strand repeat-containing protein [Luteolibacter luteus]QJE98713.1 hypothetical protein HHL09_23990 [Luteolibacter luteus]